MFLVAIILHFTGGILAAVTSVLTIVSWMRIPPWRSFKNYVFTNILSTILIQFLIETPGWCYWITNIALETAKYACICWLLVLTITFHVDTVKVFQSHTTRKTLKSTMFAWGLPLTAGIAKEALKENLQGIAEDSSRKGLALAMTLAERALKTLTYVPLLINCVLYCKTLHFLLKPSEVRRSTNSCQKIQTATLAFVMSGVMLLISLVVWEVTVDFSAYPYSVALESLQTIFVCVFFLLLKSNRSLWREYLSRKTSNTGEEFNTHLNAINDGADAVNVEADELEADALAAGTNV